MNEKGENVMAASKLQKGPNLSLDGNMLDIFGNKGFIEGDKWVINLFFGAFAEVDPSSASPEIESVINVDIADGKGDKIHHLLVNPNTALRLFLEGKITRANIEKAEFDKESVTIPGIKFTTSNGEKVLPLMVIAEPKWGFATMDQNGKVV
jgi:hypothetical protein